MAWGSWLIDQGYRGELECIVAKIFGSEAQKEAAIELFMKTHGGRSFLHGHVFGDNVHELLAPCIYEGEGEMLGLAFFKSLVKEHGKQFFEPIGKAFQAAGISKPNMANPRHAWVVKRRTVGLLALADGPEVRQPAQGDVSAASIRDLPSIVCVRAGPVRHLRPRDFGGDDQAPAEAGRPSVPHVRVVAAGCRTPSPSW